MTCWQRRLCAHLVPVFKPGAEHQGKNQGEVKHICTHWSKVPKTCFINGTMFQPYRLDGSLIKVLGCYTTTYHGNIMSTFCMCGGVALRVGDACLCIKHLKEKFGGKPFLPFFVVISSWKKKWSRCFFNPKEHKCVFWPTPDHSQHRK